MKGRNHKWCAVPSQRRSAIESCGGGGVQDTSIGYSDMAVKKAPYEEHYVNASKT
jgi:hypothetical protein